jgi:hypothetical protein
MSPSATGEDVVVDGVPSLVGEVVGSLVDCVVPGTVGEAVGAVVGADVVGADVVDVVTKQACKASSSSSVGQTMSDSNGYCDGHCGMIPGD